MAGEGFGITHLRDALTSVAQQLLYRGASLAYGGDISYQPAFNFVQTLIDLSHSYRLDDRPKKDRIRNYVAGPVSVLMNPDDRELLDSQIKLIDINPSPSYSKQDLLANDARSSETWSGELTKMRERMNRDVDARVLMGGKTAGFKGKYPGLVEEAVMALSTHKPMYIMGMFGGAAREIIHSLSGQSTGGENYNSLFEGFGFKDINPGLSGSESEILSESENLEEVVSLLIKGLTKTFSQ